MGCTREPRGVPGPHPPPLQVREGRRKQRAGRTLPHPKALGPKHDPSLRVTPEFNPSSNYQVSQPTHIPFQVPGMGHRIQRPKSHA